MPSAPPAVEDLQAWLAAKRQVLIAALAQKLVEAWDATADFDFNDFGHAAADIVARARALLALPTPQPPADGEVGELVETLKGIAYWRRHGTIGGPPPAPFDIRQADRLTRAAELLEHPTPQPVAVSERLPGAKDCALWPSDPEATPWCWAGKDIDGGWEWAQISMLGLGTDTLSRIIAGGGWTHWLPSSALPTPETTND